MDSLGGANQSFAASGAWLALRYFFVSAMGFMLSIAFARWSNPHVYGQFQVVLASMALFSVFSLPGLNMLAMRSFSRDNTNHLRKIAKFSLSGGVLAVPLVLFYGIYFLDINDNQNLIIALMAICFPFLYSANSWATLYEGASNFKSPTIRIMILSLVVNSLLVFGIYRGYDLIVLLSIYFILNIALNWVYFFETIYKDRTQTSDALAQPFDIRYGIFVSVQKYIVGLSEYLPSIIIAGTLGLFAVAQFQVAFVFFVAISGFTGAIATLYLPVLFKDADLNGPNALRHATLMGILASLGYYVFISLFFLLVYGESYRPAFGLAQFFVLLPFLAALRTFFVNLYTAKGRNIFVIGNYIAANALSIALFVICARGLSLAEGVSVYIYSFFILLLLPFFFVYYFRDSRKTPSI